MEFTNRSGELSAIYLDQNVLGDLLAGDLTIQSDEKCVWVYSNEHFEEIARGNIPALLEPLESLRARRITLWDAGGSQARVKPFEPLEEAYRSYLEAVNEVPTDQKPIHDLLAAFYASQDPDTSHALPARIRAEIDRLLGEASLDPEELQSFQSRAAKATNDLEPILKKVREEMPTLEVGRKKIGLPKGRASGASDNENPILWIWEQMKANDPRLAGLGLSAEEFFQVTYKEDGKLLPYPQFEAIVRCQAALNFVGFRPDKGLGKSDQWANILSDGRHMAWASFCNIFISSDQRTRAKARAIYQFLGIQTFVPEFKLSYDRRDSEV